MGAMGEPSPVLEALRSLSDTLAGLIEGLARLHGLNVPGGPAPAAGAAARPTVPLGSVGGAVAAGLLSPHGIGLARGLSPGLGRFAQSLQAATAALAGLAALRGAFGRPGAPAPTVFQAIAQRWAPLASSVAGRFGSVLPAGMTFQGFVGRQLTGLITQGLTGALGRAFGAARSPLLTNILGPQVANNLASRIGALQGFVNSRAFQTTFGLQVAAAVGQGLARARGLVAPAAAGVGATNWLAVGKGIALGLGLAGAVVGGVSAVLAGSRALAEGQNDRNRRFAGLAGAPAAAFAQLGVSDLMRSISLANRNANSIAGLTSSVQAMRESFHELDVATNNLGNVFGQFAAGGLTALGKTIQPFAGLANLALGGANATGAGSVFGEYLIRSLFPASLDGVNLLVRKLPDLVGKLPDFLFGLFGGNGAAGKAALQQAIAAALNPPAPKPDSFGFDAFVAGNVNALRGPVRPDRPIPPFKPF